MSNSSWILIIYIIIGLGIIYFGVFRPLRRRGYLGGPEGLQKRALEQADHGAINPVLICPHCQVKGSVRTKAVEQKKGISGGKAAGAVLTGGFSVLATGLSRKEQLTEAHCDNCGSTWHF